MYPYDDMPGGANPTQNGSPWFKPRPTQFGGNSSGLAGINSMVSALSGIQDRYNQFKKTQVPGQPMVGGQPWQPAPREGSPNLFQGAPTTGAGPAMPSAPPSAIMPPTAGAPPSMAPTPPVPFQGMNGPGMGVGGNPAMTSLMSSPPSDNAANDIRQTMLSNLTGGSNKLFGGIFG